jgi:putative ABC transport system permease protein
MWVGLDKSALDLKPWWRAKTGEAWFASEDSAILGVDAAEVELRSPGDRLFSPETGERLRVAGVLERSGTSDDSLFFVPLATAQRMFKQPGRLTAIAIRLRDPSLLREATERLQRIPGAQVVTLTEMMGTFLNLVGAVRSLLLSIALLALVISMLTVLNTLLAAVVERANELSLMRAIGASRFQILGLITTEALILTALGSLIGVALAFLLGPGIESLVRQLIPLAPAQSMLSISGAILLQTTGLALVIGVIGSVYPAWRASRLQLAEALKAE